MLLPWAHSSLPQSKPLPQSSAAWCCEAKEEKRRRGENTNSERRKQCCGDTPKHPVSKVGTCSVRKAWRQRRKNTSLSSADLREFFSPTRAPGKPRVAQTRRARKSEEREKNHSPLLRIPFPNPTFQSSPALRPLRRQRAPQAAPMRREGPEGA